MSAKLFFKDKCDDSDHVIVCIPVSSGITIYKKYTNIDDNVEEQSFNPSQSELQKTTCPPWYITI